MAPRARPGAELLAPESEWAVLEDPLESEEPNEHEADELEAHAAGKNRAVSEQRTALSHLHALRIFYGRCPPK